MLMSSDDSDNEYTRTVAYIEYVPARLLAHEREKRWVFFFRGFAVGWTSLLAIAVAITYL